MFSLSWNTPRHQQSMIYCYRGAYNGAVYLAGSQNPDKISSSVLPLHTWYLLPLKLSNKLYLPLLRLKEYRISTHSQASHWYIIFIWSLHRQGNIQVCIFSVAVSGVAVSPAAAVDCLHLTERKLFVSSVPRVPLLNKKSYCQMISSISDENCLCTRTTWVAIKQK